MRWADFASLFALQAPVIQITQQKRRELARAF
jgi:hypothetical protein